MVSDVRRAHKSTPSPSEVINGRGKCHCYRIFVLFYAGELWHSGPVWDLFTLIVWVKLSLLVLWNRNFASRAPAELRAPLQFVLTPVGNWGNLFKTNHFRWEPGIAKIHLSLAHPRMCEGHRGWGGHTDLGKVPVSLCPPANQKQVVWLCPWAEELRRGELSRHSRGAVLIFGAILGSQDDPEPALACLLHIPRSLSRWSHRVSVNHPVYIPTCKAGGSWQHLKCGKSSQTLGWGRKRTIPRLGALWLSNDWSEERIEPSEEYFSASFPWDCSAKWYFQP